MALEFQTEDKGLLVKFYFQCVESVTSAIQCFCMTKDIKRKEKTTSFNTVKRIINTFLYTDSVHVKKRILKEEASIILTPFRKSKRSLCQVAGQLLRYVKNKSSLDIKTRIRAVSLQKST